MAGETDLARLIADMNAHLDPATYVFARVPADADMSAYAPLMTFHEAEGVTLILREDDRAHVSTEFPCRRITLTIHSALEAVGFLARVATVLAEAGIPCNAVSAFTHDHLFVPVDKADEAVACLRALARRG